MTIEPSLEARAARHAALGDPSRLRIVDLLELGDLSPHDLADSLGMASNLLAHHLNALERAGVVARHRSEGDRRRSYVRLSPDTRLDTGSAAALRAPRIVFVCTANSARSQLAEHLWRRRSVVPAVSAGTTPSDAVAPGAVAVGAAHGLDLRTATPRLLAEVDCPGDLRITVCDNARETLGTSDLHWSVADPARRGDRAAFEGAFTDLAHRIDALAPHVAAA